MNLKLSLLLLALLPVSLATASDVYKWKDGEGSTNFTDERPTHTESEKVPVKTTVDSEQAAKNLQEIMQKAGLGQKPEAEPATAQKPELTEEQRKQRLEAFRKNCEIAKQNKQKLEAENRVITQNEDGSIKRWTEEERQAKLTETQQQIDHFCNPDF